MTDIRHVPVITSSVICFAPGLCPQHDVLYDTLTVKEHLWFFGILKGLTRAEAGGEINKMLESIKLADKSVSQTRYLSGGMKRKLSLGLALIGKAKVCFCLRRNALND